MLDYLEKHKLKYANDIQTLTHVVECVAERLFVGVFVVHVQCKREMWLLSVGQCLTHFGERNLDGNRYISDKIDPV